MTEKTAARKHITNPETGKPYCGAPIRTNVSLELDEKYECKLCKSEIDA